MSDKCAKGQPRDSDWLPRSSLHRESQMRKHLRIISIVSSIIALIALSAGLVLHSVHAEDGDGGADFEVVDHQTLPSGSEIDTTTGVAGPSSSSTGTGGPPRVGPNTRVNDLQQGFPNGFF